jgi:hypothetical protein
VSLNGRPPRLDQEVTFRKRRHNNRRSRLSEDSTSGGVELNAEQYKSGHEIASREESARPVIAQPSFSVESDDNMNPVTPELQYEGPDIESLTDSSLGEDPEEIQDEAAQQSASNIRQARDKEN